MFKKKNKFYITTSIAYTNSFPHIGFALESIQADVLARYHSILGDEVFFLTGTDEHGAKVVKAAEKAGKNPKDFVDEISNKFKELNGILNLSNDDFIRTSDSIRHWPSVRKVWLQLKENGDIYKKKYQGLYCLGCEAFITQKDLAEGKCLIHNKEPELVQEENYFFCLSKYQKEIKEAIVKDKVKIIPESRKNEILSFINQGLEDISFSRPRNDLKWAVPVPDDEKASVYVWADALTNYISALGYAENSEKFKKFWPADVHCIGKDILRFHAVIWLGMILSIKLKLPKNIFVHGFITVAGQKMSKSLGNVIDPFQLVEKYGTDAVRYFLLREIPSTEDGDFTYEKFETRYNSDLANGLGNLVSRVVKLCQNNDVSVSLKNFTISKKVGQLIEGYKLNEALAYIWEEITKANKSINQDEPWKLSKEKARVVLKKLMPCIQQIAFDLQPFLPETSERIIEQVKTLESKPLFPRLEK